jgi:hypothetical protein
MAFADGFKKEAAMREVGRAAGKVLSAPFKAVGVAAHHGAKAVGRGAKGFAEGVSAGFPVKRLSPSGKVKPERGVGLGGARTEQAARKGELKLTPETERQLAKGKAKEDIKERHERIKRGPSFARRHPIPTALAAYGGYKLLTSPSEETRQPQVIYPQQ